MNVLIGSKLKQTQMFTSDGKRIPVTVAQVGPCWITHCINTPTYKGIQLAFGITKHMTKAEEGHIKKSGLTIKPRFLRSFQVDELPDQIKPGMEVHVEDVFTAGDSVRVTGVSKGKGFAGVVKRHGFSGGPKTHGQSDRERAPGSIGQSTTPGRVYKGKRMAGRMGGNTVTVRGLSITAVDPVKKTVTIKGVVPGSLHGFLIIKKE